MESPPISRDERILSQIEILVWSALIRIVRVLKIHKSPLRPFQNISAQTLQEWPVFDIIKYAAIGFSLGFVAGFLVVWIVLP